LSASSLASLRLRIVTSTARIAITTVSPATLTGEIVAKVTKKT
jgi:hypothetical protein